MLSGGQVFAIAGHFVEEGIAGAELAYFIRLNAAVELFGHVLDTVPVLGLIVARGSERHVGPVPIRRSGAVSKLIVQHAADGAHRFTISGVGVPTHHAVDKPGVDHRRVVLPVLTLQSRSVHDGIDEVDFQTGMMTDVHRDLVFNEVPTEVKDPVITEVFFRFIPGQKIPLCIELRVVKGNLGVYV